MGIGFYGFTGLYDFDRVRLFRFFLEAFEEQADMLLYVGDAFKSGHRRVGGQFKLLWNDLRVVRTDGFFMVQARKHADGRRRGQGVVVVGAEHQGQN